jgi:hypothetical protein
MGRRRYEVAEGDRSVGAWFRGVARLDVAGVDWSCHDCCAVRSIESQRKWKGRDEDIVAVFLYCRIEYMWSDAVTVQVDVWGDVWTMKCG